jgi:hypothetical protein
MKHSPFHAAVSFMPVTLRPWSDCAGYASWHGVEGLQIGLQVPFRVTRPNGAPYGSPGQGRHDRRPGWTNLQGSEALKGRTRAAINAVSVTVLDRPFRALMVGEPEVPGRRVALPRAMLGCPVGADPVGYRGARWQRSIPS